MDGRRHQHAVSKLPCLVLSSAISCRSSICPGCLSTAWLVSVVLFSCHNYGLQVVTREVHRSSFRRLICPVQVHFICITVLIISMTFVLSLTQNVGLAIFICDVEHTSFHFGLCGSKFVLSLFGQCPDLCAIRHGSTHELYTCLFRRMARLLLKISRCLAYAAHPAMILRCISLSWFFSSWLKCCPKYS